MPNLHVRGARLADAPAAEPEQHGWCSVGMVESLCHVTRSILATTLSATAPIGAYENRLSTRRPQTLIGLRRASRTYRSVEPVAA